MTDAEKIFYWVNDFNIRLEKLEYCTYRRTRNGKSEVEKLRKEFEEKRSWIDKETFCE